MNHRVAQAKESASPACHQAVATQSEQDSNACPILFGLLDAKEGIAKESPRLIAPSFSAELPLVFGHPEISFHVFQSRTLETRPPGMILMPIYLQNPVLRI